MFDVDDLKIYRGNDIRITDKIIVTQPTIDQIIEFGEKRYFQTIHFLTGVGADFKWQLWDYFNIDYTTIDDFELFKLMILKSLSSKKLIYKELKENPEQYEEYISKMTKEDWDELLFNPVSLVIKDIDFADFEENKYKSLVAGFINGFCWGIVALCLSILGIFAEKFGIINVLIILTLFPLFATYYVKFLKEE